MYLTGSASGFLLGRTLSTDSDSLQMSCKISSRTKGKIWPPTMSCWQWNSLALAVDKTSLSDCEIKCWYLLKEGFLPLSKCVQKCVWAAAQPHFVVVKVGLKLASCVPLVKMWHVSELTLSLSRCLLFFIPHCFLSLTCQMVMSYKALRLKVVFTFRLSLSQP